MSRWIKWLVLGAVIAGIMVFLAQQATEKPVSLQEKPVSPDALAK
jgi:hypothetical protein